MSNRKPYTLDSYKAGKKPICRNGQAPSEWHYFETATCEPPMLIVIGGRTRSVSCDGFFRTDGVLHNYDLFEQEDVVVNYFSQYKHSGIICSVYPTLERAINAVNKGFDPIHIIELTYDPNKPEEEAYTVKIVHTY